mmetsp:Transcript_25352/g.38940  ORF Transcript_25352/g.38940 Transcript_25352/m.38940 type:complete len:252 (+) Transcript_25352:1548-2303(+)
MLTALGFLELFQSILLLDFLLPAQFSCLHNFIYSVANKSFVRFRVLHHQRPLFQRRVNICKIANFNLKTTVIFLCCHTLRHNVNCPPTTPSSTTQGIPSKSQHIGNINFIIPSTKSPTNVSIFNLLPHPICPPNSQIQLFLTHVIPQNIHRSFLRFNMNQLHQCRIPICLPQRICHHGQMMSQMCHCRIIYPCQFHRHRHITSQQLFLLGTTSHCSTRHPLGTFDMCHIHWNFFCIQIHLFGQYRLRILQV